MLFVGHRNPDLGVALRLHFRDEARGGRRAERRSTEVQRVLRGIVEIVRRTGRDRQNSRLGRNRDERNGFGTEQAWHYEIGLGRAGQLGLQQRDSRRWVAGVVLHRQDDLVTQHAARVVDHVDRSFYCVAGSLTVGGDRAAEGLDGEDAVCSSGLRGGRGG